MNTRNASFLIIQLSTPGALIHCQKLTLQMAPFCPQIQVLWKIWVKMASKLVFIGGVAEYALPVIWDAFQMQMCLPFLLSMALTNPTCAWCREEGFQWSQCGCFHRRPGQPHGVSQGDSCLEHSKLFSIMLIMPRCWKWWQHLMTED